MSAGKKYIKSPLNYIGGKYRLLPQLLALFPDNIRVMVDLFAGGGDVFANAKADKIIANDINYHVINIFQTFKQYEAESLVSLIEEIIAKWQLSPSNEQAYKDFRCHYNKTGNPMELFVLICYSFNYQIRFNSRHEYNNPFGRDRSWFNPVLKDNLRSFCKPLQKVTLTSENFKTYDFDSLGPGDFVYADPPYLITTGTYNDGRRGFEGWTETEEYALYRCLDRLDKKGVKFALSNVLQHKGRKNDILDGWRKAYCTHLMNYEYKNSNYHGRNTDKITTELCITNY